MTRCRKTIEDCADEAFKLVLCEHWEPTSLELQLHFGLSDQSVARLKKLVRARFADEGIVWGWHRPVNRYVAAPHAAIRTQKQIIDDYMGFCGQADSAVQSLIHGAYKSGSMTRKEYERVDARFAARSQDFQRLRSSLRFSD